MKARVLMVEGDAAMCRMLARRLTELGCEVTTAEDGAEAGGKQATGKFELVLTCELELPEEGIDLPATLLAVERGYIAAALRRTNGNRNQAAQLLKLNRTTLVEKLKRQT